jgi:two-component sensor histidine kinase/HPt (histidine-containing phosphotransfer) domain-containing protein
MATYILDWLATTASVSNLMMGVLFLSTLLCVVWALRNQHRLNQEQRKLVVVHRAFLHELRTPLVALSYMLEELHEQIEASSCTSGDSLMMARQLAAEALHTANITLNDPNAWQQALSVSETIQLHSFFHTLVDVFTPLAQAKRVRLVLQLPTEGATWVHTQALALRHCLNNLMDNAIKFTTSGEVILRVDLIQQEAGSLQEACLSIQVCDSGTGLDAKAQAMNAKQQADCTLHSHGLGLKTVNALVKHLGHSFTLQNRKGDVSGTQADLNWHVTFDTTPPEQAKQSALLFLTQDVCECGVELRGLFKATGFEVDLITYPGAPPGATALAQRVRSMPAHISQSVWYLCTFGLSYQDVEDWLTGFKALNQGVPLLIAVSEEAKINQLLVRFQRNYLGSCQLIHTSLDVYPALRAMSTSKKSNLIPFAPRQSVGVASAKRIMIIEDHLVQQLMLAQLLTRQGYDVEIHSQLPPLYEMKDNPAHVVFIDLSMLPSGASLFLEYCKAIQRSTGCDMLYLTSSRPLTTWESGLLQQEPYIQYIPKPVSPSILHQLFGTGASPAVEAPSSPAEAVYSPWNEAQFVASFGHSSFLHIKLIGVFKEEFQEKQQLFKEALAAMQVETALHMLHQLNGLAAYIQAEDLRKKGLRLEASLQALKNDTVNDLPQEVASFITAWEAAYTTCVSMHLTPYQQRLQGASVLSDT